MSESITIATPTTLDAPPIPAPIARRHLLKAHLELTKVRLNAMVLFTTIMGYVVASRSLYPAQFDSLRLLWTCLGTFLAATGASAVNQALEARRDARMPRTFKRPIPQGQLSRTYACSLGLILAMTGVAILCPTSNGLTATLATANFLIYIALYTPLKTLTATNTLIGAIVGGIPPMIGWSAATGSLSAGAWALLALLFVWQIPHFLALAWLYRDDYARGGFKMLANIDPSGRLTGQFAVLYSDILFPVCLLIVYLGHAGGLFTIAALILTSGLTLMAVRFARTRSRPDARRLFLASIIYLPLLASILMLDSRTPTDGLNQGPAGYSAPTQEPFHDPGQPN